MDNTELLKRTIFFRNLTHGELLKIQLLASEVKFMNGAEVLKEGAVCDAFYIVKDGSVNVVKGGSLVKTLGIGEPVGEISFMDKGRRSASIMANDDSILLKLDVQAFEKIMAIDKDLAIKIYKTILVVLCQRLRETSEALKIVYP